MKIAIEPFHDEHLVAAVREAQSEVVPLDDAEALVWIGGPDGFPELGEQIEWVSLATAGIERFIAAGILDDERVWTNASGFYADGVAEHALALLLTGLRQIDTAVREGRWAKELIDPAVRTLRGSTVTIIGAGGIGRSLTPMLKACGATVIAVNHSGRELVGADETLPSSKLDEVWSRTDHIVLAAPDTPETHHLINDETLAKLRPHSWIVNIARGPLIDQDALARALRDGVIAGAALDVTDPEPPADDDPLWSLPNLIVTPHVANPASGLTREMAPFLAENVRRYEAGEQLISLVTPGANY